MSSSSGAWGRKAGGEDGAAVLEEALIAQRDTGARGVGDFDVGDAELGAVEFLGGGQLLAFVVEIHAEENSKSDDDQNGTGQAEGIRNGVREVQFIDRSLWIEIPCGGDLSNRVLCG